MSHPSLTPSFSNRYLSHAEHEVPTDIKIFEIPEADAGRVAILTEAASITGFPVEFSIRTLLLARKGFASVRTSKESIPRGSYGIMEDGRVVILADYKTTGVGSKSKLRGMGKGKLLMLAAFFDKNKAADKVKDPKDNNYTSKFPDREFDEQFLETADLTKTLNKKFIKNKFLHTPDIKEVRIYNGLIYFALEVPAYNTKEDRLSTPEENQKKLKHYCQEAETLASILFNLKKGVYKEPEFDKGFLIFKDDNNNICRIEFKNLIVPPELVDAAQYSKAEDPNKIGKLFEDIKTIEELQKLVTDTDPNLQYCHAPIFARSKDATDKEDIFIPVMVQAGDTGENIIRDSDFEHFYKHPLVPALAQKTFNAAERFRPGCNLDHLGGLTLLNLRLNAASLDEFKKSLGEFITSYIALRPDELITLDNYTIEQLKLNFPHFATRLNAGTFNLAAVPAELQYILILAKYNDVTTLAEGTPFVNYTVDEFKEYRDAASEAYNYFNDAENKQALDNLGEACAHDMVFLYQLGHDMASHGDEGNHPKGKPEEFARITTYCNNKVIVTYNEEQYLKLLFSNPEMLDKQMISVHPYWMEGIETPDKSSPLNAKGWVDLLKIQALRYALEIAAAVPGTDLNKALSMYTQTVLLNMPRRFLKPGEADKIEHTRTILATHFATLAPLPNDTEAIKVMIKQIYEQSPHKATGDDLKKYRVYAAETGSSLDLKI